MERKKTQDIGVHNLSEKIAHQTKRLKDLHISIVFKVFLVHELEIIPKQSCTCKRRVSSDVYSDVTTSFPGRSSQWKNKRVLSGFAS